MGDYKGQITELPCGLAGMVNRTNRLHAEPDELLEAEGVTFENSTIRKEPGASILESLAAPNLTFEATLGTSVDWLVGGISVLGDDPVLVRELGANTVDGASANITVTAPGIPAGRLVVVVVTGYQGGTPACTVADDRSNTYVQQVAQTSAGAGELRIFTSTITTPLETGDDITVTMSGSSFATIHAIEVEGHSTIDPLGFDDGTGTSVSLALDSFTESALRFVVVSGDANHTFSSPSGFAITSERFDTGSSTVRTRVLTRRDDPTSVIVAMHDWWATPDLQRFVVATLGGSIVRQNSDGDLTVEMIEGLRSARAGRFLVAGREAAALNRKLFYFTGVDPVTVIDGHTDSSGTAALASPPADWTGTNQPVNGLIHQGRVCAFGNANDPHRLYFSTLDDHEDFTGDDTFTIPVRSGVGERLYCGVPFGGLLWLWKYPRGVFYLDDSPLDSADWLTRTKSEGIGCAASPWAVLPLDDDVLWLAADGTFHLLSAVDSLSGVRASDLSYRLGIDRWLRENVNLARLDQVVSAWYPHKRVAYFGVPAAGDVNNTLTLKFDFGLVGSGGAVRFSFSRRDIPNAFALRRDSDGIERPMLGEGGTVYRLDQPARNKNGVAYDMNYRTPRFNLRHVDPRLQAKRKHFDALEFTFEPTATGTITVQPYVDGIRRGPALTFDATKNQDKKALEVGSGRDLSWTTLNSTLNEDAEVLSHILYWRLGDQDQG